MTKPLVQSKTSVNMDKIYIRIRGQVQGPFTPDKVRALAVRGKFSRLHEVSSDKRDWKRAAEFPELFPQPTMPPPVRQALETAAYTGPVGEEHLRPGESEGDPLLIPLEDPSILSDAMTLPTVDDQGDWYYAKDGQEQAPVPFERLRRMASAGKLAPSDYVWTSGMNSWVEAHEIEGLFRGGHDRGGQDSWMDLSTGVVGDGAQTDLVTPRSAIASLVFGILGTNVLPVVGSILAIVFGHIALRNIRLTNGHSRGRGLAVAGLLLGYVVLIALLLGAVVAMILVLTAARKIH